MLADAIAITLAEGSHAARYGVVRLSLPCAFWDRWSQMRTVLSMEQERKSSLPGQISKDVTGAVCPLK